MHSTPPPASLAALLTADGLLDKVAAAKFLGQSTRTLDRLTAPRGPIPAIRIGARILFDPADLRTFIASRRVAPATTEASA